MIKYAYFYLNSYLKYNIIFTDLDQMSGSWNMDECGDQMAQGLVLLLLLLCMIFLFHISDFLV